jgi:hypothetical protein
MDNRVEMEREELGLVLLGIGAFTILLSSIMLLISYYDMHDGQELLRKSTEAEDNADYHSALARGATDSFTQYSENFMANMSRQSSENLQEQGSEKANRGQLEQVAGIPALLVSIILLIAGFYFHRSK